MGTFMSRRSAKYRRIYEKAHKVCLLPGIEIHHLDGDKTNNDLSNLEALTTEEHYKAHEALGDWGACKAISLRMEMSLEQRSEMSKKLWRDAPPGRIPVTDGTTTKQLLTEDDVEDFLQDNPSWRRGRAIAADSGFLQVGKRKMQDGSHNMLQKSVCPHCGKEGNAVVMKRWHFDNCKLYK